MNITRVARGIMRINGMHVSSNIRGNDDLIGKVATNGEARNYVERVFVESSLAADSRGRGPDGCRWALKKQRTL